MTLETIIQSGTGYFECTRQIFRILLLSRVWLFVTPWTRTCQAHLSSTALRSWVKFMLVTSVTLSNHLVLCRPTSGAFPRSLLFSWDGQSIEASASGSVLPVSTQGWFPSKWIGLFFLQCRGLSSISSSSTIQKHQFFSSQPSLWSSSHFHTWIHDH